MTYLKQKLGEKTWIWTLVGVSMLLLWAWFFGADVAHAQAGAAPAATAATSDNEAYAQFLKIVLLLQSLMNKILWPILFMIGGLMDNDLIFNHGMETRLFSIWVQIRNIVNILFVIALVGLALYNVLGIGGEGDQFSLKAVLPKLIVGIIAVNFSYIGIKILLDAVNLGTTAIFSLPEAVEQGLSITYKDDNERKLYQKLICENLYGPGGLDVKSEAVQATLAKEGLSSSDITVESNKNPYICVGVQLNQSAAQYLQQYGSRNAALVMALNMGKIAFFDKAAVEGAGSFAKLSLNVLFSLVLYFVYVFSFVALFIILIARLIVIWLAVAMSPFLMLSMALPGGIKEKLNVVEKIQFTKHAFVPLAIAIPMTIGYMMLQAFQGISFEGSQDFSLSVLTTGTLNIGVATSGLSTLQDLMIAIATIGVVWKGVFDAAEGTLAEGIVQTIKGAGESLGGFIGSVPFKYIPWVPVTTGSAVNSDTPRLTPSSIMSTLSDIPGIMERKQKDRASKVLWEQFGIGDGSGAGNPKLFDDVRDESGFKNALSQNYNNLASGDRSTGLALQKLATSTMTDQRDVLNEAVRRGGIVAREQVDIMRDPKSTPEQVAKAGYKLAEALGIKAPSQAAAASAAATPAATAADPAAPAKGIIVAAGGRAALVAAVQEMPDSLGELKTLGKEIAASEGNDAKLTQLSRDKSVGALDAYSQAYNYAGSLQSGDLANPDTQYEVGAKIRTAEASLASNTVGAAVAKETLLKKVEAQLGNAPNKDAIMGEVKAYAEGKTKSDASTKDEDEG